MRIGIIGAGYVGLVAGVCLAEMSNTVTIGDCNKQRVEKLQAGQVPHYEPGLDTILLKNQKKNRLAFTLDTARVVEKSDVIFMAVGTPPAEDGSLSLNELTAAITEVADAMDGYRLIVVKSTVPPGTCRRMEKLIASRTSHDFDLVSNPEFLKEGCAVNDFMRPDRLIIGARTERAKTLMRQVYALFFNGGHTIMETDPESAEMIKYASNVMLASRISLINEIAGVCQAVGADVEKVRIGIGLDRRIGGDCLHPGLGYGGSCFPKDVNGMVHLAHSVGAQADICRAVSEVNQRQHGFFVPFIEQEFGNDWTGRTFAFLGLAYKPHTDDVRESPSLALADIVMRRGAKVRGFDPEACERAAETLPALEIAANIEDAASGADALFVCTEWNEFRTVDWTAIKSRMKTPVIFDGRNIYEPGEMAEIGLRYYSIGRAPAFPAT